ncbi:DNA binding protein [Bacillus phage BCD7]|uniref:Putative histone family protein DNA-binding protein n=1 Tax=Bacillus phage BCD7 TaxID=1136534 RepID=J9PUL4_9CAUD|nr:DNA binding protein [Bacillus phage BCD7]AEZ50501.1 putative histone family protein DNA-binding protein [Bacillus phage BCD7]
MKQLSKEDLARQIVADSGRTKKESEKIIDDVLIGIIGLLESHADEQPEGKKDIRAKLTLVGFGSFALREIPARVHRNPQNGEKSTKPAHNKIKFTEGKTFAESVN